VAVEVERWQKRARPLGFSKTVGVPPAHAARPGLALGKVGGRPRLAVAAPVRVDDDGQEPRRMGLRPEATTSQTTLASTPWCGNGC